MWCVRGFDVSSCLGFLGAAVVCVLSPISIFISNSMPIRRSLSSYPGSLLGSLFLISNCISLSMSKSRASSLVGVVCGCVGDFTVLFVYEVGGFKNVTGGRTGCGVFPFLWVVSFCLVSKMCFIAFCMYGSCFIQVPGHDWLMAHAAIVIP